MENNISKWLNRTAVTDIELSSRVRLARNINGVPFTHMLEDDEDITALGKIVEKTLPNLTRLRLSEFTDVGRALLVEKHLISPRFSQNGESVFINEEEDVSVMIGEEDHLRIQSLGVNESLESLYEKASAIDDTLESKIEYAFDERYGYLTACPTNLGTGMRASIMLHLPALTALKRIQRFHNNLTRFGFTLRGIYGEGSKPIGSVYQLSNQVTLGFSETDIIENLTELKERIIEEERSAREQLKTLETCDAVNRSFGILQYAYKLPLKEAAMHLSNVKLGIDLGYIDFDRFNFQAWFQQIQPAFISQKLNEFEYDTSRPNNQHERLRATLTRELLGGK
ncbi:MULTISPECIES: protein arginine kinase [Jeotgalicoccus]|uniref:protein arginine kinase n=1 Tax=Jeotgalicoccus TaxID=227979 RepID=UPI0004078D19|nr:MULTISPECIES: protein arginine kinase [Jeotgalicoccus]